MAQNFPREEILIKEQFEKHVSELNSLSDVVVHMPEIFKEQLAFLESANVNSDDDIHNQVRKKLGLSEEEYPVLLVRPQLASKGVIDKNKGVLAAVTAYHVSGTEVNKTDIALDFRSATVLEDYKNGLANFYRLVEGLLIYAVSKNTKLQKDINSYIPRAITSCIDELADDGFLAEASALRRINIQVNYRISTACVLTTSSGFEMLYNPYFVAGLLLTDKIFSTPIRDSWKKIIGGKVSRPNALRFLLLHELYHLIYTHEKLVNFSTAKNVNIVGDYKINTMLQESYHITPLAMGLNSANPSQIGGAQIQFVPHGEVTVETILPFIDRIIEKLQQEQNTGESDAGESGEGSGEGDAGKPGGSEGSEGSGGDEEGGSGGSGEPGKEKKQKPDGNTGKSNPSISKDIIPSERSKGFAPDDSENNVENKPSSLSEQAARQAQIDKLRKQLGEQAVKDIIKEKEKERTPGSGSPGGGPGQGAGSEDAERSLGTSPFGEIVKKLIAKKPLNWRALLRRMFMRATRITPQWSSSLPSRRLPGQFGRETERIVVHRVVFMFDVSGSIHPYQFIRAIEELGSMMQALMDVKNFDIFFWDTQVQEHKHVTRINMPIIRSIIKSYKGAQGGTDLTKVLPEISKKIGGKADAIICFTDGQIYGMEEEARQIYKRFKAQQRWIWVLLPGFNTVDIDPGTSNKVTLKGGGTVSDEY